MEHPSLVSILGKPLILYISNYSFTGVYGPYDSDPCTLNWLHWRPLRCPSFDGPSRVDEPKVNTDTICRISYGNTPKKDRRVCWHYSYLFITNIFVWSVSMSLFFDNWQVSDHIKNNHHYGDHIYIYNDSLRMIPLIIKQSLVVGCEAAEWGLALHDQPVGYWRRGQPGGAVLYNLYEGGFWEWSLGWCMKLLKLISMTIQWESENVLKSKICLCYCWSDQQHKDTERLHIWHWKTR